MVAVVHDPILEQSLRDQRVASENGRFDEVWEGVYYMNAMPNDEHQELVSRFVYVLQDIPDWSAAAKKSWTL